MKTRNRLLAMLLTFGMILTMLPMAAVADDPVGTPQYTYEGKGTFKRIASHEEIEPGLYVLYGERNASNKGAMNNTLSSSRFGSTAVTLQNGDNDIIAPDAAIVWELIGIPADAGDGYKGYYLYNEKKSVYAVADIDNSSGFTTSASIPASYYVPASKDEDAAQIELTSTGNNRMISIFSTDFRTYPAANYNPLYLYKLDADTVLPDPVAPVTLNPAADVTVLDGQKIQLSCETANAAISWNYDGGATWTAYNAANDDTWPVIAAANKTIYLKASDPAAILSDYESGAITYTVHADIPAPTASPNGGAVLAGSSVTLSGPDGGEVYYTTGAPGAAADPTTGGTLYANPITITEPTNLRAAVKWSDSFSAELNVEFTIRPDDVYRKITSAQRLDQSTEGTQYVIASMAKMTGGSHSLYALSADDLSGTNSNGRKPIALAPNAQGEVINPAENIVWTMQKSGAGYVLSNTTDGTTAELVAQSNNLRVGTTGTAFSIADGQTNKGGDWSTESGLFQITASASLAIMANDSAKDRYALYAPANYSVAGYGGYLHLFKLDDGTAEPPLAPTCALPNNSYVLDGKTIELTAENGAAIWYSVDGGAEAEYQAGVPLTFSDGADTITVTARAKRDALVSSDATFTFKRVLAATTIANLNTSGALGTYYMVTNAVSTLVFPEDGELYLQDSDQKYSGIYLSAPGAFDHLTTAAQCEAFEGKAMTVIGRLRQDADDNRYLDVADFDSCVTLGASKTIPAPVVTLNALNGDKGYTNMVVTARPVFIDSADPDPDWADDWYIITNPTGGHPGWLYVGDMVVKPNIGDTVAINGLWFWDSGSDDTLYPISIMSIEESAPPALAVGAPTDESYLRNGAVIALTAGAGAEIYYTLDGWTAPNPSAASPDGPVFRYDGGITLDFETFDAYSDGIAIRAVAVEPNLMASPTELELWYYNAVSNHAVKSLDAGDMVMVEGYVTFAQPDNRIYLQEEQPVVEIDPDAPEPPEAEAALVGTAIAAEGNGLHQYVGQTVRVYGRLSVNADLMYTVNVADGISGVTVITPSLTAPAPIDWETETIDELEHQSMLVSIASGEITVLGEDADGFWNYSVTENNASFWVRSTDPWDAEDGYTITALKGIAWCDGDTTILTKRDWVEVTEPIADGHMAKPRADLLSGTYLDDGATVTLSHAASTAEYYYTTDGISSPDTTLSDGGKTRKTTGAIAVSFGGGTEVTICAVAADSTNALEPSTPAAFTYYKTPSVGSIVQAKERADVVTIRGEVTFTKDGNAVAIQDSETPGSGIVVRRSGVAYGAHLGALVQVTGRIHEDEESGAMVLVPIDAIVTTDPAAVVGGFRVIQTTAAQPLDPIAVTLDDLSDGLISGERAPLYQSMLVSLADVQLVQRGDGTASTYHFLGEDHYIGLYAALSAEFEAGDTITIPKGVVWLEEFWPYLHALAPVADGEAPPEETVIAAWTRENLVARGQYSVHESGLPADGGSAANIGSALIRVKDADGVASSYRATIEGSNNTIGSIFNGKWNNGEYWEISFKTAGFTDVVLRFGTYGVAGCPPEWRLEYSTNGTDYTAARTYEPPLGSPDPLIDNVNNTTALTVTTALPALEDYVGTVYVRLIPIDPVIDGNITRNNRLVDVTVISDPDVPPIAPPDPVQVKPVTAQPADGTTIADGTMITLATETEGATIRYTTDGTAPTESSTVYAVPFAAAFGEATTLTIKAYAVKAGMTDSAVAAFTYAKESAPPDPQQVAAVTAQPADGATIADGTMVTLATATEGATIRYTTDGTAPTEISTVYTVPFAAAFGEATTLTIRAYAVKAGMTDSAVAAVTYTKESAPPDPQQVAAVTAQPADGATIADGAMITLATATEGATIRYTTDGTAPTESSTVYTAPFAAAFGGATTLTIKAYAVKADMTDSAVDAFTYAKKTDTSTGDKNPPSNIGGGGAPAHTEPKVPVTITDVPAGTWYYQDIAKVIELDLMRGDEKGRFNPEGILTRDMFVTVLHRLAGEPVPEGNASFDDVQAGAWYETAVRWAAENGVAVGTGTGFGVNVPVTREAMVVFLYRFLKEAGKLGNAKPADLTTFVDGGKVSDWAAEAVAWAVAAGILNGNDKGELNPAGNAMRAEAAALFVRVSAFIAK